MGKRVDDPVIIFSSSTDQLTSPPAQPSHISTLLPPVQLLYFKTTSFRVAWSPLGIQELHAMFTLLIPSVGLVI